MKPAILVAAGLAEIEKACLDLVYAPAEAE
jgi:hypothetical protein